MSTEIGENEYVCVNNKKNRGIRNENNADQSPGKLVFHAISFFCLIYFIIPAGILCESRRDVNKFVDWTSSVIGSYRLPHGKYVILERKFSLFSRRIIDPCSVFSSKPALYSDNVEHSGISSSNKLTPLYL